MKLKRRGMSWSGVLSVAQLKLKRSIDASGFEIFVGCRHVTVMISISSTSHLQLNHETAVTY